MNETVDKVADKLITSIQKSQNSNNENNASDTDTPKAKAPPKPRAASKTKAAPKTRVQREPGVKKIIDEVLTSASIESPRKLVGNLRWPD